MGIFAAHVGSGTFSTRFLAIDTAKRVRTVIDKRAYAGRDDFQFRARWQCMH